MAATPPKRASEWRRMGALTVTEWPQWHLEVLQPTAPRPAHGRRLSRHHARAGVVFPSKYTARTCVYTRQKGDAPRALLRVKRRANNATWARRPPRRRANNARLGLVHSTPLHRECVTSSSWGVSDAACSRPVGGPRPRDPAGSLPAPPRPATLLAWQHLAQEDVVAVASVPSFIVHLPRDRFLLPFRSACAACRARVDWIDKTLSITIDLSIRSDAAPAHFRTRFRLPDCRWRGRPGSVGP